MAEDRNPRPSFGANVWLIDEMYRRFIESPESVGETWRDFFADYRPVVSSPPPAASTAPSRPSGVATAEAELPPGASPLRGGAARIVENMERSLALPTATSSRTIPVMLLQENRRQINRHLQAAGFGKVSFTHLIAWAVMRALRAVPAMAASYRELDGAPHRIDAGNVNLGLAVDVQKSDGSRTLLVPNIKGADRLDFAAFFAAYNDVLRRSRTAELTPDDFAGTTVTLTNPGTLGTVQSVPRLMEGQGLIVATGSIDYPPEFRSADPRTVARLGVAKVMTVTSTYDHRVIQGAESGVFLRHLEKLLQGEEGFYEEIFRGLQIPFRPVRLSRDRVDSAAGDGHEIDKAARVMQLINMYRVRGHLLADLNPLGEEPASHPELDPHHHGLSLWDLDREFVTDGGARRGRATLREILDTLQDAYCRKVGVEYMHIQNPEQKSWIQRRVEGSDRRGWVDPSEKRRALSKLNAAEAFEAFLQTKYIGHKRFSLEGAESLIPTLDHLFTRCLGEGVEEVVMGMAHRGRLNVLANVLGKSYGRIFREFDGEVDPASMEGTGDVKYHLGTRGKHVAPDGRELPIALASNPSHLEAVDPVVEGMARARQDILGDTERQRVLALLIHGDAAFAGQGVVAETLNLSQLSGFRTGGTIHIVVNNHIGFTTAPRDARSSHYATDVARMVQAPIFHVNGDDPEACMHVVELALGFRQAFRKDVVVDVVCYRRHGHNEADEPSFTQPVMYDRIEKKRSVRKLYTEALVNRGEMDLDEAEETLKEFRSRLETAFAETRESGPPPPVLTRPEPPAAPWPAIDTAVDPAILGEVLDALVSWPDGFEIHPKLARSITARRRQYEEDAIDWGLAEALAFGSLLLEGSPVRLSGQDSRRGTFSQRHAVLVDQSTAAEHVPLAEMRPGQAPLMIHDSDLSEYAVVGFEYGYSVMRPEALTAWEAQFGDFVNGAQIIVDQFLSSAEDKWGQTSRLALLLPHGYEGQGPEHSSARVERFLTLCAASNMRVTVPTTPAQYFHLLREQVKGDRSKPLVVLTPKSLLRSPVARSAAAELSSGTFRVMLDDPSPPDAPERLLLCSGKVAYDLLERRDADGAAVAVARVEQLYPFPRDEVSALLERWPSLRDVRWVQEEPRNMGSWSFAYPRLRVLLPEGMPLDYAGRPSSGSPASGSLTVHRAEQAELVRMAFE